MNKPIRSGVINGDGSGERLAEIGAGGQAEKAGEFVSASRELRPGEAEQLSGGAVVPAQAKSEPTATPKHEPAVTPPQDNPAVPYDKHHGKGGCYALVNGKRIPADDQGKPLPEKK